MSEPVSRGVGEPRTIPAWAAVLADGKLVGHALLTRCHIDDTPALCLGPVAVLPEYQKTGVGSAAIRTALQVAKDMDEHFVTVLGHPTYYPRFGFTRASTHGIGLTIDVPDEAMMALTLDADHPLPGGTVRYAAPSATPHRSVSNRTRRAGAPPCPRTAPLAMSPAKSAT